MTLGVEDFPAFVRAVHGHEPFPWQMALLRRVVEGDGWPAGIAAPTGAGKTLALDVALWHLVLRGAQGQAPRRLFWVVDRRLVADQVHERALRMAETLQTSNDLAVRRAAEALRALDPTAEAPLDVRLWRGGTFLDDDPPRSPARPTIVVSTVDQVGSRLLFRGYGVSDGMRPVHAGLVGMDSLILLDEAHLSQPFADVVAAVNRLQSPPWCGDPLPCPAPVRLVRLTATAGGGAEPLVGPADRRHGGLGRRLAAAKPARLVEVRDADLAAAVAARALALLEAAPDGMAPVRRVGAVLNTVAQARAVHRAVKAAGVDTVLLTGRMRPHDRDAVWSAWKHRLLADAERDRCAETPCVVVATQAIEVGVDLDLDALVSEAAPLSALAQRAGRVDRLGQRGRSPIVLVCPGRGKPKPDRIYGPATAATWRWLAERAEAPPAGKRGKPAGEPVIDLGWATLGAVAPSDWDGLAAPLPEREPLDAVMAGLFAQTRPRPEPDPDPALFLHGRGGEGEVHLVWRADLDPRDLSVPAKAVSVVAGCPPVRGEALALPLSAARRWLAGLQAPDVLADTLADLPVTAGEDRPSAGRPALWWEGPDDGRVVPATELRAGMTLIVPAAYGGIDPESRCWDPACAAPVEDVAETARPPDQRAVLRLHPGTAKAEKAEGIVASLARAVHDADTDDLAEDAADRLRAAVAHLVEQGRLPNDHHWLAGLSAVTGDWTITPYDPAKPRLGLRLTAPGPETPEPTTADDRSLEGPARKDPVPLLPHCAGVAATAQGFTRSCGLSGAPAEAVRMGALLHDVGKAEPRMQVWLHGGDRLAAALNPAPIAKSAGRTTPAARTRAGLPRGVRHELWSLALAERVAVPEEARELMLWLVATHHGYGRPLPPVPPDGAAAAVTLPWPGGPELAAGPNDGAAAVGAVWPARFQRLNARFGFWGLAWLEAMVRLADHRRSAAERREGAGEAPVPPIAVAEPSPPPARHELKLPGLRADTLLGFLAGLGTLRLLTRAWAADDVRLAWDAVFPHAATLSATRPLGRDGVLDALLAALDADLQAFPAFDGQGDVGFSPDELRRRLAGETNADAAAFLRAFATPTGITRNDPAAVEITPFVMLGAGQTNFLKAARALAANVGRGHLERTLFRAWDYADAGLDSLRWDPEDAREHAYALHDPASPAAWKGNEPRRMAGANRLALAALPCLPVVPCAGHPRAAGTRRTAGTLAFVWPVWSDAADLATARALLTAPEVQQPEAAVARPGLAAVLHAPRAAAGRYPIVLPARPLLPAPRRT